MTCDMCGALLGRRGEAVVRGTPAGTICARCADEEEHEEDWWDDEDEEDEEREEGWEDDEEREHYEEHY